VDRNKKVTYFGLWTKIRKSHILVCRQKSEKSPTLGCGQKSDILCRRQKSENHTFSAVDRNKKSHILGCGQKSENRIFWDVDKNQKITYLGLWIEIIKSTLIFERMKCWQQNITKNKTDKNMNVLTQNMKQPEHHNSRQTTT
jgi:hypothetical protein